MPTRSLAGSPRCRASSRRASVGRGAPPRCSNHEAVLMSLAVRAPGKAIVCGEYAVLEGAPAISIAIDRYVVARLGEGAGSPFVTAALAHAARALGDASL